MIPKWRSVRVRFSSAKVQGISISALDRAAENLSGRSDELAKQEFAAHLIKRLDSAGLRRLEAAMQRRREVYPEVLNEAEAALKQADTNADGVLQPSEFHKWFARHSKTVDMQIREQRPLHEGQNPPTWRQLGLLAVRDGLPFVGFGFIDNSLMILAGESIECQVGVTLGLSTMASAALGNTVSDVFGIGLGKYIELAASRIGLPSPGLSNEQLMMRQTKLVSVLASSIAICVGCLLGMFPLLLPVVSKDEKSSSIAVSPEA
mmetsp:Transcript_13685/g.24535  ORF Transcript_13685/g.24535 Transcript_13685/m.24535 type:complete len:262 (+) Transcript_13685:287-1072(+)